MKALIWIGCIFSLGLILALIRNSGVILGGLPSALLFGATLFIANYACKQLDKIKGVTSDEKQDENASENLENYSDEINEDDNDEIKNDDNEKGDLV